ncbi:MAG: XRE family transcriptional regulator [Pseudomonadota bacterium]|nr:XRE family transcriptional regulator [Pseudomonadota bacterium]
MPAAARHATDGATEPFGPRLRRLRQGAGLTLKQLAARANLASSTISKIENDRMSPTYDVLLRLAGGLRTDLSSLLADSPPEEVRKAPLGRRDITRAAERRQLPTGTYVYEPLATGLKHKAMDPTFVKVTARSIEEFGDLIRHPGEELVYVVSGAVEMHAEFYAPVRLEAGDSVYFDANMGHAYVSVSPQDALILNICAATDGRPLASTLGIEKS